MTRSTKNYACRLTLMFVAIWIAIGLVGSAMLPDLGLTYLLDSVDLPQSYKIALCFFITMVVSHGLFAILQGAFKLKRYNFNFLGMSAVILNLLALNNDMNSMNIETKINEFVVLGIAGIGLIANFTDHFFYIRNKVKIYAKRESV